MSGTTEHSILGTTAPFLLCKSLPVLCEIRITSKGSVKPGKLNFSENDDGEEKEILKMLHTILRDQYTADPSSRTIIFVTTRKLAQYLSRHLNIQRVVDRTNRAVGFVTSKYCQIFFFH